MYSFVVVLPFLVLYEVRYANEFKRGAVFRFLAEPVFSHSQKKFTKLRKKNDILILLYVLMLASDYLLRLLLKVQ